MLTDSQIRIITECLDKGYDVEIQNRKNGIAIMQYKKEVKHKPPKKFSDSSKS